MLLNWRRFCVTPRPRSRKRSRRHGRCETIRHRPHIDGLEDRTVLSPGQLDPTFGSMGLVTTDFFQTNSVAHAIAIQADGKIVAGGLGGYTSGFALARYNANGSLDTTFGSNGDGLVTFDFGGYSSELDGVAIQGDGKIVVAGWATTSYFDTQPKVVVARLNPNGSLDTSFGSQGKRIIVIGGVDDEAHALAIQPDGKIVLVGQATSSSGSIYFTVLRLTNLGSFDLTFGNQGGFISHFPGAVNDAAYAVRLQPDGKIVAAGYTGPATGIFGVLRLTTSGAPDATFGNGGFVSTNFGGDDIVYGLGIQTDGKIDAAGEITVNGLANFGLARYNANGTLDSSFGTGGKVTTAMGLQNWASIAKGLVIQPNGKLVAAGYAYGGGNSAFAVARYTSNGALDSGFGNGGKAYALFNGNEQALAVALQGDGKIVTAGETLNERFALARFLGDSPAQATHFSLTPSTTTVRAGTPFTITVRALDAQNNLVPSYTGTVHFTSTDGRATLPGNYTFTAADAGVHTFSVTLATPGNQTVTATDIASGITGNTTVSVVSVATHFSVTPSATTVTAGVAFTITVQALDAQNNRVPSYTGTVHFTSTDSRATLPANYTFTAADAGVHTFSVTLATPGNQAVTATDTSSGITGNTTVTVAANSQFNEYPVRPGSAPIGIAVGPDGNLYFTEQTQATNQIGVMNPSGTVIAEYPVPTANSRPEYLVAGPDGNMWFTEQRGNQIAALATDGSGTITEFPTPTPNSAPTFITVGPDGNVWFTEENANQIGYIDLAGGTYTITEFPIPTVNSGPIGITAGPDGNIWFTEINASQVGYIDLAGGTYTITEFPIPTANSQPVGIAAGPDGNIWFTESNANQVAALDLAGGTYGITELPIPSPNSFSQDIIAGPDGNMWFTETGNPASNKLGSVDLVGGTYAITEYAVPTAASAPVGLTIGPSGTDIWFAEVLADQIGQFVSPPTRSPARNRALSRGKVRAELALGALLPALEQVRPLVIPVSQENRVPPAGLVHPSWTPTEARVETAHIAAALASTAVPTLPAVDGMDEGEVWPLTHPGPRGREVLWPWWEAPFWAGDQDGTIL